MVDINYDINNLLFPFDFAIQHFKAIPEEYQAKEVEWEGRIVAHIILGVLELLFPINYIIAAFERIIVIEQRLQRAAPPAPQHAHPLPPNHPHRQAVPPHVRPLPGAHAQPHQAVPPRKNAPVAPPKPLGAAAKTVPVKQAADAREAKELLEACLHNLLDDLQFGLTGQFRPISQYPEMLGQRGIHTLEDLHALGLFGWDDTLQRLSTFRLGLVPQVPDDDTFLAQELLTLTGLEKRADPDPKAKDFDRTDMHRVRDELITIAETLQELVAGVFKEPAAGYAMDTWNQISERLVQLRATLDVPKNKRIDELNTLKAIVAGMQTEEPKRLQAMTDYQFLEPHWTLLKTHVKTVTEHVTSVRTVINDLFQEGQYSDAEAGMVKDLKDRYEAQIEALGQIAGALKDFDAAALPRHLEDFKEILTALDSYTKLESVVLLRLYVNQVNVTTAWKAIEKLDIPSLAALKQINPEVDLFHLAQSYA